LKKLIVLGALGAAMAVLVFAAIAVAQSTAPALNNTATVDIRGHAFDPAQLNVAPGTTVRFVNNDTEPHTATADNGLFDTGVLQPGSSFEVFLDGSGTVPYHCELHPDMKGTVVVGGASGGGETGTVDPASSTPPEQTGTTTGDPASTPPNQAASVYPQ
jgi:plastocyanin